MIKIVKGHIKKFLIYIRKIDMEKVVIIMNSIKKNLFYNSLYQILVVLTPLITSPYISRVLGANGLGIYSYSYTIANYFLIFAMLGVMNYGNRSIAKVRSDRSKRSEVFWSIYLFQLIFSIVIITGYVGYIVFLCKENFNIAIIQILVVFSAAIDISWFFFGMELFKITAIRSIIIKIITVVGILIFVKSKSDVWIYCLIMSSSIFLTQLSVWPFLRKYVDWKKPKTKEIIRHFKPNLVLFIPVVAISLYKSMDKIMLGNMNTMTQLGYYENAEKIITIPMSLITALGTVMLPRMCNLIVEGSIERVKQLNENSFIFVTFMSCAFAFGILAVADVFIPAFFGNQFTPVIKLLVPLVPTMVLISWANIIRTQHLLPHSQDGSYIISVFVGAFINLIINILLIKQYGAMGAAIGTLIAEISVTVTQIIAVWNEMEFVKYIKNSIPFLIFSVIMYFSIKDIYITNDWLTVITRGILGAAIYIVLSSIYIYFFKKEIYYSLISR